MFAYAAAIIFDNEAKIFYGINIGDDQYFAYFLFLIE